MLHYHSLITLQEKERRQTVNEDIGMYQSTLIGGHRLPTRTAKREVLIIKLQ